MSKTIRHTWTDEQKEYLKEIAEGKPRKEIKDLINAKFNLNLTQRQINTAMHYNKIKNGIDPKFKIGNKVRCKQNNGPSKPVGTETYRHGYIKVKNDKNCWKFKHRHIWEQHYGEIPKGYSIIFLDKNKDNFDINNLAMVNKKELLFINDKGLLKENAELSKVGITLAKLMIKSKELERGKNE